MLNDLRKFYITFATAFLGSLLATGATVIIAIVLISGAWTVKEFALWIW